VRNFTAVVRRILGDLSGEASKIVTALSITLGNLKVRKSDEYHKEDEGCDSEYEHDFDDGEAFFRFDIEFFHLLSFQ